MTPLRLAFMGTPQFAVPTFEALLAAGHEVAACYSQPPRPAGRGHRLTPSPVHTVAEAAGIEVRTPKSLRGTEVQAAFKALELDAAVVVAYGLILPPAILWAPRLGCFNLHASLLPRWRGAAPIQRAIWAGDDVTGLAAMAMTEGLDEGPVVIEEQIAIDAADTAGRLHDKLSLLGGPLMADALALIATGRVIPRQQSEDGVTYATKISKEDGRIDWARPAEVIERQIRALSPTPGAFAELNGERLKVVSAHVVEPMQVGEEPGTALDDCLTVACGRDALRLDLVQRAGKAAIAAPDFLHGFPVAAGTRLK